MATGTPSNKVSLKKGFGLMDWVKLTTSTTDLAGVNRLGGLRGYRIEEVRQHRTEHDAWAVFNGKVYNITPYLHYHPGGAAIMWKAAGRDCTALFNRHHPWVNLEGLAGKLIIGYLIDPDEEEKKSESGSAAEEGAGAATATSSAAAAGAAAPGPTTNASTATTPPSSQTGSSSSSVSSKSSTTDTNASSSSQQKAKTFPMEPPPAPKRISVSEAFGAKEEEEEEEEGEGKEKER